MWATENSEADKLSLGGAKGFDRFITEREERYGYSQATFVLYQSQKDVEEQQTDRYLILIQPARV